MMAESREDISGLVEALVMPLVDDADAVSIDSLDTETGASQADAGKVIGRQGRVIKAIRTLARAAGSRHGLDVEVELIDE